MKNHTKIYLKAFGYDLSDQTQFIPCEITGAKSVDIHHIIGRGKGGEDRIENLMAVTREQHIKYGDKKHFVKDLLFIHQSKLKARGIKYDADWFKEQYLKYAN